MFHARISSSVAERPSPYRPRVSSAWKPCKVWRGVMASATMAITMNVYLRALDGLRFAFLRTIAENASTGFTFGLPKWGVSHDGRPKVLETIDDDRTLSGRRRKR